MLTIGVDGRVLHGPLTGTGWYTAGLLTELARRDDVTVRLLVYPRDARGPVDRAAFPRAQVVAASRLGSRLPGLAARTKLPVGLDRLMPRCDAYLFPNYRRTPVSRGMGITVVYDLAFRKVPHLVNPAYLRNLQRSADDAIKHSDLVVTPSMQIKKEILESYELAPARVVAVLPGPRHRVASDRRSTKRRLILHVGTLEPRKNVETLITAYDQLPQEMTRAHPLVLAGKAGWGSEHIARLLEQRPHIRWMGYLSESELAQLYDEAAVLVTASHYEGLGLPVLEALASGIPVVCSELPAHREVCGGAAKFFRSDDAEALGGILTKLLRAPRDLARLSAQGIERAAQFSWAQSVQNLLDSVALQRSNTNWP